MTRQLQRRAGGARTTGEQRMRSALEETSGLSLAICGLALTTGDDAQAIPFFGQSAVGGAAASLGFDTSCDGAPSAAGTATGHPRR